ncbi:hypothetical protein [Janthinobacterium rivuli]|uniref:hypothetical protein n=1 Tax=Janthinobacterium rivuli TaxID=2751478 RepID=UPI00383A7F15
MSTNPSIHRVAFGLQCDDLIYTGMSRAVWTSSLVPDCVIKIEERAGYFQNVVEWETWQRVKDTPLSRWFAACRWISPNGTILVMERTRAAGDAQYPEKMPAFLCDFKRRNYGMSGEFLVCHDYGTNMLFENGMTKRMIKADWSDSA